MKLAVYLGAAPSSAAPSQARWRLSGGTWKTLRGPLETQPDVYELALALGDQLAEDGLRLSFWRGEGPSGLTVRLEGDQSFDLELPADSLYAPLGFAFTTQGQTRIDTIREPQRACLGLQVARWESPRLPVLAPRGNTLDGEATLGMRTSRSPFVIGLAFLEETHLQRLIELWTACLREERPLTAFALREIGGLWRHDETKRWRLRPDGETALKVTRRVVGRYGPLYEVALTMEVEA